MELFFWGMEGPSFVLWNTYSISNFPWKRNMLPVKYYFPPGFTAALAKIRLRGRAVWCILQVRNDL